VRGRAQVQRSRHLGAYAAPKTGRAERALELFPEVVRLLRGLQPLHVTPETPVFTHTRGGPIEPNSFLPHWYAAQRACGIRVRGLYSTKDTFVTTALAAGVKIAWLEEQTGVAYATLKRHYGTWMPLDEAGELRRFAALEPGLFASEQASVPPGGLGRGGHTPQPSGSTTLSRCERGDLNPTCDRGNPVFSRIGTVKNRQRPSRIVPDRHNLAGADELSLRQGVGNARRGT
jgi:hypothetical protein